ncbi:hypothetical protein QYF36_000926 [Acer negundo]|nr:hypothetical protein QYF36_000926 [Acer negundo]
MVKPFTSHVPPLPPGPPGLPLLGNLPFLETDLHRYFAKLSEIYGPIMKLQLGRKFCVVISSPSLAKQVLKYHDAILANRDPPVAGVITAYGGHDIAWSPNNPEWRKLCKIFVQEMMCKTSLDACHALRRQEVREMAKEVYAKVGSAINIGDQMFITILNVIMNMSWGGSLHGEDRIRVGIQFRQVVEEVVDLLGAPNISDLFPALARFDLQGVESKTKKLLSWFDRIFESLIDGRAKDRQETQDSGEKKEGKASNDFLEILLELNQNGDGKSSLSMNQVKALLMDMVVGGTHTSSTTIEWAMTELLQHPVTMRKACEELEQVRDPEAWESSLEFQPERFMRDAGKGLRRKPRDRKVVVYMGNGEKVFVEFIGVVRLPLASGKFLDLVDVAFVPSFRRNLIISISRLDVGGYRFEFTNKGYVLYHGFLLQ